jgi:hypothetical protein
MKIFFKTFFILVVATCTVNCSNDNENDAENPLPPDGNVITVPTLTVCNSSPALDMTGAVNYGDGTAASCTQEALQALITAGGKITFNGGNAPLTLVLKSTLNVPSRKEVIIDGKGLLTISGNNSVRIFNKDAPSNQGEGTLFGIQNMKLINGKASNKLGGAAILGNYFGSLKVINVTFDNNQSQVSDPDACGAVHTGGYKEVLFSNCVFTNNKGANGGAVGTIGSASEFINCKFENNRATGTGGTGTRPNGFGGIGGAVYNDGVDQNGVNNYIKMCGCTFINNTAGNEAGAVSVIFYAGKGSTMTMDKCSFEGNSCTADKGGAFYFMNGSITLSNTTFANNSSPAVGGGVWATNYNATIYNCTFTENNAVNGTNGLGGGLALDGSGTNKTATVTYCTFAENRAGDFASGIFNGGNLTITNSLFYKNKVGLGNQSNADAGAVINKGSNLTVNAGNLQFPKEYTSKFGTATDPWITPSVLTTDALLQPLADNQGPNKTMALGAGSPAIVKASITSITTDQRGKPRKSSPDIGAFETQ